MQIILEEPARAAVAAIGAEAVAQQQDVDQAKAA